MNRWGVVDTKIQRFMLDFKSMEEGKDNVTSIRDMANLLEKIYDGSIFKSKETREFSVEMLKYQRVDRGVRTYLPDWETSYKSGEVGEFYHDIGIVFLEDRDFILGIFVDDALDPLDALEIISRIKKAFLRKINEPKNQAK